MGVGGVKRLILLTNDSEKVQRAYVDSVQFLNSHEEVTEEICRHLAAYDSLIELVPETPDTIGSGHLFPFIEVYSELENSFMLCKQGFYRYGLFALRCALELGILGVHFDRNDRAYADIEDWFTSERSSPSFSSVLPRLFHMENFRIFDKQIPLQKHIKGLYASLSNFAHTRGYKYSTSGQSHANFSRFS